MLVIFILTRVWSAYSKSVAKKGAQKDGKTGQNQPDTIKQVFQKYFEGGGSPKPEAFDAYQSPLDPHSEPHYSEGGKLEWGSMGGTSERSSLADSYQYSMGDKLEWGSMGDRLDRSTTVDRQELAYRGLEITPTISFDGSYFEENPLAHSADGDPGNEKREPASGVKLKFDENAMVTGFIMSEILQRPNFDAVRRGTARRVGSHR